MSNDAARPVFVPFGGTQANPLRLTRLSNWYDDSGLWARRGGFCRCEEFDDPRDRIRTLRQAQDLGGIGAGQAQGGRGGRLLWVNGVGSESVFFSA